MAAGGIPKLGAAPFASHPVKLPRTLSAKLVATGTGLLLLALASISLTLWVTWELQGGAAAVNEAGRMRMHTYRMAMSVATGGEAAELQALARTFDDSLALLEAGDPSRPLFVPWSDASREGFAEVRLHWHALRTRWLAPVRPADPRADADAFVLMIDGFVAAIEAQIAYWTAVLHLFQLALVGLAIASAVVMFYAGYLFVLNPLARLQRGLAALQSGDLGNARGGGRTRRVRRARGRFQRHGANAAVPVRRAGGKGAAEDAGPGAEAPAPGRPVRGERLRHRGADAGGPGAGLRTPRAPHRPRRRGGRALARRSPPALSDPGARPAAGQPGGGRRTACTRTPAIAAPQRPAWPRASLHSPAPTAASATAAARASPAS
jgi:hypothetical protein